jgi:DNA-binding PadR family transcriptional regulator
MDYLTRREELVLLSIGNLKENAYLVSIREHLSEIMEQEWSISTIHIPLRRLEKSGYINSYYGEATAVRGGRRKKIYILTEKGYKALGVNKRVNDRLWSDYNDFEIIKG